MLSEVQNNFSILSDAVSFTAHFKPARLFEKVDMKA